MRPLKYASLRHPVLNIKSRRLLAPHGTSDGNPHEALVMKSIGKAPPKLAKFIYVHGYARYLYVGLSAPSTRSRYSRSIKPSTLVLTMCISGMNRLVSCAMTSV